MKRSIHHNERGFLLMEIMIAVGMFAFAVIGLASALNRMTDVELLSRRDRQVRIELASRYDESQLLPLVEETRGLGKDANGIEYFRDVKPLEVTNEDGAALTNLFKIRVRAMDPIRGDEINFIEVYAYQP